MAERKDKESVLNAGFSTTRDNMARNEKLHYDHTTDFEGTSGALNANTAYGNDSSGPNGVRNTVTYAGEMPRS